jgi:LCP family protein required for cell wall assembly
MKRFIVFLMVCMLLLGVNHLALAEEKNVINILLLGTDDLGYEISGEEEMSRADAIYVLNLHSDTGAVKLLSVERDYLVTLPDGNGENKLATATYFGGPELCMSEVNELLNLKIDKYIQIDITRLIEAVDAIGGLEVEVFEEEVEEVNSFIDGILSYYGLKHVKAGMNLLNGPETWAFIGVRNNDIDNIESNTQRNNRQQRAVKAGLAKLAEISLDEALDVIDKVLPHVKTNITMGEIITLTQDVQANDAEKFIYKRSPITPFSRQRAGFHQVVVADNMEEEISAVHAFLFE